jgi:hypothetical protein
VARAATPAWQSALNEFIAPYRAQRDVIGALVCGSYVTGAPTPRSDIDVAIVLAPRVKHRERGNRIVGRYLVEYFANPPAQFRAYFAHGHACNRPATATMFATGRVLFDQRGAVRALRAHARRWLARPFALPKRAEIASERYYFWDLLDNLRDLDERGDAGFAHAYHHHVHEIYAFYARCLQGAGAAGATAVRVPDRRARAEEVLARGVPGPPLHVAVAHGAARARAERAARGGRSADRARDRAAGRLRGRRVQAADTGRTLRR